MEQIFEKTEIGRDAIANRFEGMSAKARRLLILVDGNKSISALTSLSGLGQQFIENLHYLIEHGLIKDVESTISSARLQPVSTATDVIRIPDPVSNDTILPSDFEPIRQWMADSGRQYLGIMGSDIIRKIESANDLAALRRCTAPWITALRDSKKGAAVADMYLAQVNQQLGI